MIPQAGVAIGLAVIIEQTFPTWGRNLTTIILALIAIHQILGPLAFRYALAKSGELNREQITEDEALLREWDKSISPDSIESKL